MHLERGLLCGAGSCLLIILRSDNSRSLKTELERRQRRGRAGKHHTMKEKFSRVSKIFLLFTSNGRNKSEPWQLKTIRCITETECRLQIRYLHGRQAFCFFGVRFSSYLLITKKGEDQNISLALLLSEPDFSQEIYIFLSFSVKVSFPVFSPTEL